MADTKAVTLGLVLCYVDDMLLLKETDEVQKGLIAHLRSLWKMSTEVELTEETPMTFIGLELKREKGSRDLQVHQQTFVRQLLAKYGLDKLSKPLTAVQMPLPEEKDTPPTAAELKVIQAHAGEFNWLATRTRGDIAYYTSIIASAATRHGQWTLQLCKRCSDICWAQWRREFACQQAVRSLKSSAGRTLVTGELVPRVKQGC